MFWMFILLSAFIAVYAIMKHSWGWMVLSGIWLVPFLWYLDATPRFNGALLILLLHLGSAIALRYHKTKIAVLSLIPTVLFVAWVAVIVLVYD
jgi:hypothetical protein